MIHSNWQGSHYEAGFQYGAQARQAGVCLLTKLPPNQAERLDFSRACLPLYERHFPQVLSEIRGIAAGQKVPFDRMAAFLLSMYAFTPDAHCSCFAFSQNGSTILGRNSDFFTWIEPVCDSAYYALDGAYPFIGNTTAWSELEDGLNACGLAAGLTYVYSDRRRPGLNAGMLVRCLLETCGSTDQAIAALERLPIASAQTITLADASGRIAVVECDCDRLEVRRPGPAEGAVFAANGFVSPRMRHGWPPAPNSQEDLFSLDRYQTLEQAFSRRPENPLAFAFDLLSGGQGFLCQYDRENGADTVWSAVYDLTGRRCWLAEGNPSRTPYREDQRLHPMW